jgi:purine-binding chemotaxis protein CheW
MPRYRHDPSKDLVGFLVGDVMYAVRIEVVREIVNPLAVVDLPRAPKAVRGVADYRGEVVPVVDLRERFGLPEVAPSRKTKWIVLDVGPAGASGSIPEEDPAKRRDGAVRARAAAPNQKAHYAALVVDSVSEVFGLAGGELRPAPPLGAGDDTRGIEGVTTLGSRLVFVLDARAFGADARAALGGEVAGAALALETG